MPDECRPIEDSISEQKAVIRLLAGNLAHTSSTAERDAILAMMQMARDRQAELQRELEICREDHPAPLRPNIGFHFNTCLAGDVGEGVENALNEALADERGVAHVDCINNDDRIGIWLPAVGEEEERRAGLEFTNAPIRVRENFGMEIYMSFIKRRAKATWDQQPKAYNSDGDPDTHGPIFLTDFSFRTESPHRVITTLEGFRRFPSLIPDVDFTLTVTDTFRIETIEPDEIGMVKCDSTTDLDADFPGAGALLELLLGPIGVLRLLFHIGVDIFDGSLAPDEEAGAVGCSILQHIPRSIRLTDTLMLGFTYERIEVFSSFILLGGTTVVAVPEVADHGFSLVSSDLSVTP